MHLFLKLFILVKYSACFGRSFRPSSGAQDCIYSNRHVSNRCYYLLLAGISWNCSKTNKMHLFLNCSSISSPVAAGSSSGLTYACCCMCSFELLMMDGKTVRNMQSILQE